MSTHWRWLAALALCCCGSTTPEVPELAVSASPRSILPNGEPTTITASVADGKGKPQGGKVTLSTSAGLFSSGEATTVLALKADGTASSDFSCDVASDPSCADSARIEARWDGANSLFLIEVLRIELKKATTP